MLRLQRVTLRGQLTIIMALSAPTRSATLLAAKRGVIVNLINDQTSDSTFEIVSVIEKTFTVLGAAPYVDATTGNVTIPNCGFFTDGNGALIPDLSNIQAKFVDGYSGLVAGDKVLYYQDTTTGIYHIEKAKSVTGQMTDYAYVVTAAAYAMTFGGTLYFDSGLPNVSTISNPSPIQKFGPVITNHNQDATAWLDDNGSVVYVKLNAATAATTYGVVLNYTYYGLLSNSAQVRLLKQDGTIGIYNVAPNNLGVVSNQGIGGTTEFSSVDTSGAAGDTGVLAQYILLANNTVSVIGNVAPATTPYINTGLSADYGAGSTALSATIGGVLQLSPTTPVFYYDTASPYSATNMGYVTIGYAKTVARTAAAPATSITYILAAGTNTIAAVLFKTNDKLVTGGYAYRLSNVATGSVINGIQYYDYPCYVDGVYKTLRSALPALFNGTGLFYYTTDASGNVIASAQVTTPVNTIFNTNNAMPNAIYSDHFNIGGLPTAKDYVTNSATMYYDVIYDSITGLAINVVASTLSTNCRVMYVQTDSITGYATAVYFDANPGVAYIAAAAPVIVTANTVAATATLVSVDSKTNIATYSVTFSGTSSAATTATLVNGIWGTAAGSWVNATATTLTLTTTTDSAATITFSVQLTGNGAPAPTITLS